MNKKRSQHYLTERDIKILIFLWEYRVATTSMIHQKFFTDLASLASYTVLYKLKKYSYIAIRTDEYGKKPLWTLENKGFLAIKDELLELKNDAFKSESREHDLI